MRPAPMLPCGRAPRPLGAVPANPSSTASKAWPRPRSTPPPLSDNVTEKCILLSGMEKPPTIAYGWRRAVGNRRYITIYNAKATAASHQCLQKAFSRGSLASLRDPKTAGSGESLLYCKDILLKRPKPMLTMFYPGPSLASLRGPKTADRHGRLGDSSWDDRRVS